MPIYRINNRNVLFIHVPKTGGTSVESFLRSHAEPALHNQGCKLLRPYRGATLAPSVALQHFHAELLTAMLPMGYFDYAFMIVRHPMRRLISEYGHSRKLGRIDSRLPFNSWAHLMLNFANIGPCFSNNHYRPQNEFHCFDAEVFRFEEGLPNILERVAQQVGVPHPAITPHEKKSSMRVTGITAAVYSRVQHCYAGDFAAFEYDPVRLPEFAIAPVTKVA